MHSFPLKTMVLPGRESKIGREKKWSFRARKSPKYPPSVLHLSKISIYFPSNQTVSQIIFYSIHMKTGASCQVGRIAFCMSAVWFSMFYVFYSTVKSQGQIQMFTFEIFGEQVILSRTNDRFKNWYTPGKTKPFFPFLLAPFIYQSRVWNDRNWRNSSELRIPLS